MCEICSLKLQLRCRELHAEFQELISQRHLSPTNCTQILVLETGTVIARISFLRRIHTFCWPHLDLAKFFNFRKSEDFCISINLDGRNLHQVLSVKDGIMDHNATRSLLNPPLLLCAKEATISCCPTKLQFCSIYLQSKFAVSLGRASPSRGSISQVQ